jgi:hypothetical protein
VEQKLFYSIHSHCSAGLEASLASTATAPSTAVSDVNSGEARHVCSANNLDLPVTSPGRRNAEETRLTQCLLQITANIDRNSVIVVARDCSVEATGDEYVAILSLRSMVNTLCADDDQVDAARVTGAQVCVYRKSGPTADDPEAAGEASLLLALELRDTATSDGVYLCKLGVADITFAAQAPSSAAATKPQNVSQEALLYRKLTLKSVSTLVCSAPRGVAWLSDATTGRVVVVDVEAEAEEDGSDESGEGSEEEERKTEAAGRWTLPMPKLANFDLG